MSKRPGGLRTATSAPQQWVLKIQTFDGRVFITADSVYITSTPSFLQIFP